MKILVLLGVFMVSLIGRAEQHVDEFKGFIEELKIAASEDKRERIALIYSEHYIESDIYLHKTPTANREDLRAEYVQWFIDNHINNADIIKQRDENFSVEDGIYQWSRKAIFKGYEDRWEDWDYSFVKTEKGFQVEPHFTHPSPAQLRELLKLKNVYALYFSVGNAKTFNLTINGVEAAIGVEPYYSTLQLQDIKLGDNEFRFLFKKIDASKPVEFSASLVFIARTQERKEIKNDSVINLIGEALAIDDTWNSLSPTDAGRVVIDTDEFITKVTLD